MPRNRWTRRVSAAAVALVLLLTGLLPATPAQADPNTQTFTWNWGFEGDGAKCTISISMGRYSVDGKVNLRGTFNGCIKRVGDDGLGSLTVISDAPVKRLGGTVGESECWRHNYCTMTVGIPFKGTTTYCGHAWFADDGYRQRHNRDPYLYACAEVSK